VLSKVLLGLVVSVGWLFSSFSNAQMDVQLAKRYGDEKGAYPVTDYLVSEKYDGIRGIWTGKELLSRQGKPIHAPAWFIQALPKGVWLDGELWSKHHDFQFVASAVTKDDPVDSQWHKIYYMVFDAPDYKHNFAERSQRYVRIVQTIHAPSVKAIKQFAVPDNQTLSHVLNEYVKKGAEGLVLHRKAAMFQSGRTGNLLKLKPYMDDEATVIGKTPGQGKYKGMLGALIVEMPSGTQFKIGTGFTDEERANPPHIGDVITYQYHGFTKRGIPRFASFMRVRYPTKEQPVTQPSSIKEISSVPSK